ncbi:MAG: methyltransferase domain-containing protein [bacterium]|nr:methyltransferase domain-containing protein [bacterium]
MSQATGALYETLARYQWWRRRWSRASAGEGLEIRKRLAPAAVAPEDSGAALDRWLFELANVGDRGDVLDLGCGFGATLLRWLEWTDGRGVGVTASPFQARSAMGEAARRGLADRCELRVQDFTQAIAAEVDAAIAVEALGHAHDLATVLGNVARSLRPGGRFVWVEDLLAEPFAAEGGRDEDVDELSRRWFSPPLRSRQAARDALRDAGLTLVDEHDLTPRVQFATAAAVARRAARLARWRWLPIPPWQRLADAFLGGCALERLYARGVACYVVLVATAPPR